MAKRKLITNQEASDAIDSLAFWGFIVWGTGTFLAAMIGGHHLIFIYCFLAPLFIMFFGALILTATIMAVFSAGTIIRKTHQDCQRKKEYFQDEEQS